MRLPILIPVYNERTVVERSLTQVLRAANEPSIRFFRKKVNEGEGAAVRTAIQEAHGDFCVVQDADLEYDPSEYPALLRPLLSGHADVVFGTRYLAGEQTRVLPFWHAMINFLRTPNVSVLKLDPEHPQDYPEAGGPFDTVLCVNVLEYLDDPATIARSAANALYGTLDKTLGHRRRLGAILPWPGLSLIAVATKHPE